MRHRFPDRHFFFVPVAIGLAVQAALLPATWHRDNNAGYLRLTRFFVTRRARHPTAGRCQAASVIWVLERWAQAVVSL
jgi:hypothetical protein